MREKMESYFLLSLWNGIFLSTTAPKKFQTARNFIRYNSASSSKWLTFNLIIILIYY